VEGALVELEGLELMLEEAGAGVGMTRLPDCARVAMQAAHRTCGIFGCGMVNAGSPCASGGVALDDDMTVEWTTVP